MDGLSGAASVIAVVGLTAKIATLCFQYANAVKDAKSDIERLKKAVADIKHVLESVAQLLDKQDKSQLSTSHQLLESLDGCRQQLTVLKTQLEPGKARKAMKHFSLKPLKWPFTSTKVDKIVASLEKYQQTFNLALQVDQTGLILNIDQKLNLIDRKADAVVSNINVVKLPIAAGAFFDSHKDEHNARCLHNTRVELLGQIIAWAKEDDSKPIFWLNGMAGTGKSTIARTVAQLFASQQLLGASFFFKRGEGERGNAARFFTTIATALMARLPEMIPGIREAIASDQAICDKALKDQFEKLIFQPLDEIESLQGLKLVLVIDAMDECERDQDIRAILQLLSRAKALKNVSLRVFVTSRPELHIRLGFKQMPNGTYKDLILHKVSKETIEHDIRIYLKHELSEIQQQRSLSSDWPSEDQIKALVEQSTPLFISAATVCRYIGDWRDNPRRRLEIVLGYRKVNASKLDATYLPILAQLLDEDEEDKETWAREFRMIVGSIAVIENPLPIRSLAALFHISKEDIYCRLDSLHSVLSIPDNEDEPVRLLHLSFREFLTDAKKKDTSPFWVDERDTHRQLASLCLELMSGQTGLRKNMCDLLPDSKRIDVDEWIIARSLPPELQYACRYWVHHLEQGQYHINEEDSTHIFLQAHFLHWLEAMSLIGETNKCIYMIEKLQTLLSKDTNSSFLRDAKRFVLRFRPVLEDAPLQIYYSALMFAPQASVIRQTFQSENIEKIMMLSKRERNWDACRSVLGGHTNCITSIAFSPDGRLVASASTDCTIRLWETTTGSCRSVLQGHTNCVRAVTFSPDGQLVISTSDDRMARLWETATGSCCNVLKGHTDYVRAVNFSPDGEIVASASDDSTVRLWAMTTGSCRSVLEGHTDYIRAVIFSPDGELVASASGDNTVRLWDTATGSCHNVLRGHTEYITAITFSPDGELVASASVDGTVRLWETATGSCRNVLKGHTDYVRAVAFSPDGEIVASASDDETVRLWEMATGSFRNVLKGHTDYVRAVTFSPNEKLAISASDDRTVRLWETATGSCRSVLEGHTDYIRAVIFSPDGELVASASDDMTVRLWETAMGPCHSVLEGHTKYINAVVLSPDGELVASASVDSTIRLWETGTGSCCSVLEGHTEYITAITFSPDGELVASASGDGTVRLWETTTGLCRSVLEGHTAYCIDVTFSLDGELVASTSGDSTIRLWETATGSCRSVLEGHTNYINTATFSPDGQLIASASVDKTVRLWETATGLCRNVLQGHTDHVRAVTFSPDGEIVASASNDRTVRLWEAATGLCRSVLKGHTSHINTATFSLDGQLIASASSDGTFRLWGTATGSCRSVLEGHTEYINTVTFSPDGRCLRTDQGTIPLLTPSTQSPLLNEESTIYVIDQWIGLDRQRLLWLPSEYQHSLSIVDKDLVCLVHPSNRLVFLKAKTR